MQFYNWFRLHQINATWNYATLIRVNGDTWDKQFSKQIYLLSVPNVLTSKVKYVHFCFRLVLRVCFRRVAYKFCSYATVNPMLDSFSTKNHLQEEKYSMVSWSVEWFKQTYLSIVQILWLEPLLRWFWGWANSLF